MALLDSFEQSETILRELYRLKMGQRRGIKISTDLEVEFIR